MAALGRVCLRGQFKRWHLLRETMNLKSHEELAKRLLDAWFESPNMEEKTAMSADNTEDELLSVGTNSRAGASQLSIMPSQDSEFVTFSLDGSAESTLSIDEDDDDYTPSEESEDDDSSSCCSVESLDDLFVPGVFHDAEDIPIAGISEQVYGTAVDHQEDKGPTPSVQRDLPPQQAVGDAKSVVFESCLLDLASLVTSQLGKCNSCHSDLQVQTHYIGSAIYLKWVCSNKHVNHVWCSQPKCGNMHLGDFLQSCALLTSGNNYSKLALFHRFLNVGFVNMSTYYRIQRHHCIPVIDEYWLNLQHEIWHRVSGEELVVSGDGRNDSPGHCAHYCTYIIMDTKSKSILDVQIIDKRETGLKSPNMEKVGLHRALTNLLGNGIIIREVVTDGHLQIAHMMKNCYPDLKHSLDVWHGAKNFSKKITAVAAEKNNQDLKAWIPDIINHFWFSCKTCLGSVDILRAKMRGMLHHVVGDHTWISGDGVSVAGCEHEPITGDHKPWLLPQYNRIFQKKTKNWSIFEVKENKTYNYIPELLTNMVTHYCECNSSLKAPSVIPIYDPRTISSTIACKRPPSTEFLVDNKKSRF